MKRVELSDKELRLVLQSLQHCLATCHEKTTSGGPCEDCQAATTLRDRLQAVADSK